MKMIKSAATGAEYPQRFLPRTVGTDAPLSLRIAGIALISVSTAVCDSKTPVRYVLCELASTTGSQFDSSSESLLPNLTASTDARPTPLSASQASLAVTKVSWILSACALSSAARS